MSPGLKSLKTVRGEFCMEIILQAFRDVDYTVDWRILKAVNCGVPQTRRRIFIYGHNNAKTPTFPLPTHFGEDEG
jgi:DNA (cytosine-5)-methyltransferase 1